MELISNNRLIEAWNKELLAGAKAAGTIKVRLSHVRLLLAAVDKPAGMVRRGDIVEYLAAGDWSLETRRSMNSSFRQFWQWGLSEGHLTINATARLPRVARPRPIPTPASDYHVMKAMREAPAWVSFAVEIMATCGLRRAEVATLRSSDVRPVGQGWILTVRNGKGNKSRAIPCPPHIARRIYNAGGWVFKGGQNGHVSAGWLGKSVSRAFPDGLTAHKIRHRYASVAYEATRDLRAVQELLGHASVATTQVYVAVNAADLVETAAAAWKIAI